VGARFEGVEEGPRAVNDWGGLGWQAATRVAPSGGPADREQWAPCGVLGLMIIVLDPSEAQASFAAGTQRCASCSGVLAPWGYATQRVVRGREGTVSLRPPRVRCRSCRVTHVVVPARFLPRASATAEVVGDVLVQAAGGRGHRRIAAGLGVAADTVRGWIRRATANAERLRDLGTVTAVAFDPESAPINSRRGALADAVESLAVAAMAVRRRLGVSTVPAWVEPWHLIAAICRGALLRPPPRSG